MLMEVDMKELESFLNFLQDKVEEVYKEETGYAIKSFLKEKELSKCKENINTECLSPLY